MIKQASVLKRMVNSKKINRQETGVKKHNAKGLVGEQKGSKVHSSFMSTIS